MHWFLDPIQNHYADFSGRASRQQFWMFILACIIVGVIAGVVDGIIGIKLVTAIVTLALIVPSVAISARRLHDTGKTAWLLLLGFVPFVGPIILIVLYALKGDAGTNQYGPASSDGTAPTDATMPAAVQSSSEAEAPTAVDAEENTQQGYGN